MAGYILPIFLLFSKVVYCVALQYHAPENSDFVANYSHKSLFSVPKHLPPQTTTLDLQHNSISVLPLSSFQLVPKLRVLSMSYNLIRDLDCDIFTSNKELIFLDLSHNRLENISGQFSKDIQHLDLSFNNFKSLSMCAEFGHMERLEYLGLGAQAVNRSDLQTLQSLHLQAVFLELQELAEYEPGSLQMLNTKRLHLDFPTELLGLNFILSDAVNTSERLQLSDMSSDLSHRMNPEIFKNSRVSDVTFHNMKVSWPDFVRLLQSVWQSSVQSITLNYLTIVDTIEPQPFQYVTTKLQAVTMHKVEIQNYMFSQDIVYRFVAEMNILNLTVIDCNILSMLCPYGPSSFRHINFANNALTDQIFQNCYNLNALESLILKENKLKQLSKVSIMASLMTSLKYLDVSQNTLGYETEECHWPGNIVTLNMATNELTGSVFNCLPTSVKKLDLRHNRIESIPQAIVQLDDLEELNLASNRLHDIPDCDHFKRLTVLSVAMNSIRTPSPASLQSCHAVSIINAENNTFLCDCNLREFIYREKSSAARLAKWPEFYQCKEPDELAGTFLQDFHISEVSCNTTILIILIFITIGILIFTLFCLCKFFDIPWYIKMLWQWTQTKRRTKKCKANRQNLQQNFIFHAFISYSEHDSAWVKHCLLPNLEQEDGSIQICQHERNFVPGKSIVENIINCIDQSFKSIFVLSPNFIQSEWCHYELYFAQHKVFTENSDDLILILLEPIPKYLIPARYHKLKALMALRTYMEWPKEKGKQRLFWANLRAAITITLPETADV